MGRVNLLNKRPLHPVTLRIRLLVFKTRRGRIVSMTAFPSSKIPAYRITLFFGPEVHETDSEVLYCVFNVKKRSWKGGIQLVVEMTRTQAARLNRLLQVETWLQNVLLHLPQRDYDEYFQRGRELFLQYLCRTKLQLAIEQGLRPETSLLSQDVLIPELEKAIQESGHALKDYVLAELDVPEVE